MNAMSIDFHQLTDRPALSPFGSSRAGDLAALGIRHAGSRGLHQSAPAPPTSTFLHRFPGHLALSLSFSPTPPLAAQSTHLSLLDNLTYVFTADSSIPAVTHRLEEPPSFSTPSRFRHSAASRKTLRSGPHYSTQSRALSPTRLKPCCRLRPSTSFPISTSTRRRSLRGCTSSSNSSNNNTTRPSTSTSTRQLLSNMPRPTPPPLPP